MRALVGGIGLVGAGSALVLGTAMGYGYGLGSPNKDGGKSEKTRGQGKREDVSSQQRHAAYDSEARKFDEAVSSHERWSGINRLRRQLLWNNASGDVLEVAAGTGRNFAFYDTARVTRLTALDASDEMVSVCREKLTAPDEGDSKLIEIATVGRGDAESLVGVPDGSVDTVVDTFGLCSFDDPVAALREMARVCKPETGRILLLEHGRSKYVWLSNILDAHADAHAARWGCYWNRDVAALVAEAGLELVESSSHHAGTTWFMVARLRKNRGL
jgi:methyltransferase OMS1, mitochondrial